ncbi:MAG: Gfo/Idh/MocA family oxidoreductase [Phycisphaerae bacterium]|nr:Gfo/Idh/MocA family oxidoreductase [Phycisphaerae bacterium]
MKKFAIIGVGGYIAPRHLQAIKDTGNECIVALDKNDSVGVIDSYFPNAAFFTEFERFDRFIDKRHRDQGDKIDYVSICSPNYLHDAHIRFALRVGANAICEKPIVLNPWNLDALEVIAGEYGGTVNVILQLRLHEAIRALREKILAGPADKRHQIELTYITPRGKWYLVSWKGDVEKSGGVATNIGVHFFDMLTWIFGSVKTNTINLASPMKMGGVLELERADVKWFLSLDRNDLPDANRGEKPKTFRSITVDGEELEFSEGFTTLHTTSYQEILAGRGFTMEDTRQAIDIVSRARTAEPIGLKGEYHPILKTIKAE